MNLASLPKYQQFRLPHRSACDGVARPPLSPRLAPILLDVAVLLAVALLLCVIRRTGDAAERAPVPVPPRQPLAFELIAQRRKDIHQGDTREQVERLLGPPTRQGFGGWEAMRSSQGVGMPEDRVWGKWADPEDTDRWVAVLFAGGKVYSIHSK